MRAKDKGVTTIVITQRPALLNIVDKVLILRGGRADAFGPPRDVLRRVLNTKAAATQALTATAQAQTLPASEPAAAKAEEGR
jgi:ATP-binding cassette subfamily C protein